MALIESVSSGYFDALGVGVRQGREFRAEDFGQDTAVR